MFAGKKSAQIREILISESAWEEMTCLFAPSLSKFNLTPRQIDVLNMIMRGLPNKRIAAQLSISEPTVKEHISNILKKIGVNSRVEAITLLHGKQEPSE
ncbi:two component LuxR family transcriptional regulator [Enterobacter hormaechei]|nr:two component LuxR family transcriptional regulator [Enterobacter hormaechei]